VNRFQELIEQLSAPDTLPIEQAAEEMVRSGDMRFVEPLVALLQKEDVEGAHVADHVVWVIRTARRQSDVADEVLRRIGELDG
jgi:hypothetical protein